MSPRTSRDTPYPRPLPKRLSISRRHDQIAAPGTVRTQGDDARAAEPGYPDRLRSHRDPVGWRWKRSVDRSSRARATGPAGAGAESQRHDPQGRRHRTVAIGKVRGLHQPRAAIDADVTMPKDISLPVNRLA